MGEYPHRYAHFEHLCKSGNCFSPFDAMGDGYEYKNYKGLMAWRVLVMLAVIKGILSYISFCLQTVIEFTTV